MDIISIPDISLPDNLSGLPVVNVSTNRALFSPEFEETTANRLITPGFSCSPEFDVKETLLENFSIDTVRLRFIISENSEYIQKALSTNIKHLTDGDVKRKLCKNIFGQKVEFWIDEGCRVFLEFSLPKFLYGSNCFRASFNDLLDYCREYVLPYVDKNSYKIGEPFIKVNRLDIAFQYKFSSSLELSRFDEFLRTVQVRKTSSSKDYCFWQFKGNRYIRFYDKKKDIERQKPELPKNLNTFNDLKEYQKYLEDYRNWKSALDFCDKNNIGRLEYEFKDDYLEQKYGTLDVFDLVPLLSRENWNEVINKDFPFDRYESKSFYQFNLLLNKIEDSFQRPAAYLKFFILCQRFGFDKARESISDKAYWKLKTEFKKRIGLTFEQALVCDTVEAFFPGEFAYQDSLNFEGELPEFKPDMLHQYKKNRHINYDNYSYYPQSLIDYHNFDVRRC